MKNEIGIERHTLIRSELISLYKQLEDFIAGCTCEEVDANKDSINAVLTMIHQRENMSELEFKLYNETMVKHAFGKDYHRLIEDCLKAYTYTPKDRYKIGGCDYDFVDVPNVRNKGAMLQFAIFGESDGIMTLAYYSSK